MERFFILGCQRSGTTLIRLVLESHSDIECLDERSSYAVLAGKQAEPVTTSGLMGFKIPIWTEQLLEPTLDGNELALESPEWARMRNFYDREKIIFMVRDPLDTVASMMKLKLGDHSWLQLVGVPVLERKMSDPLFAAEYGADLSAIHGLPEESAGCGALYWKFKSNALIRYRAADIPVHSVIYEKLVAEPERTLKDVTSFLGVAWEDSMLTHHLFTHTGIRNGKATGNTDPARSIDDTSVGQWRQLLTDSQVRVIRRITDPVSARLRSC